MKAFLVLMCVYVATHGSPIENFILTSEGPGTTINPGTTGTVTPATVRPGSSQGPDTTVLPVSIVTVSPGDQTSEPPFTGETTMSFSSEGTTQPSPTTASQHSMHSIKTPSTTIPPSTPAPQKGGFDGGSFAGGIALGAGIAIILYVAYRIYASKKTSGYSTM